MPDLHISEAQTVYRTSPTESAPVIHTEPSEFQVALQAAFGDAGLNINGVWGPLEIGIRNAVLASFEKPINGNVPGIPVPGEDRPLNEADARDRLRKAIAELETAEAETFQAAILVTRTQKKTAELTDQIAQYDTLDEEVLQHQLESIKRGRDNTDLPANLAYRLKERAKLADRLNATTRAVDRLSFEARHLDTEAHQRRQRVSQAAQMVIGCIVESHIDSLIAIERQAAELRRSFASYGRAWFPGVGTGPKTATLSVRMYSVINEPPANVGVEPDQAAIDALLQWHTRLLTDADAE